MPARGTLSWVKGLNVRLRNYQERNQPDKPCSGNGLFYCSFPDVTSETRDCSKGPCFRKGSCVSDTYLSHGFLKTQQGTFRLAEQIENSALGTGFLGERSEGGGGESPNTGKRRGEGGVTCFRRHVPETAVEESIP
ncbi:hypothetical protein Bbelb_364270 [Branchiostoma belcheri]|nr:hypothetical protein Bbelb_364270 [Branchiostoma belcheri]